MADVRVTCITKPNTYSAHEHITHLGGPGWKWTREEVIRSIEGGTNKFYVLEGNKRSDVGVVNPGNGHAKYLRTYADGQWNNNLLSLAQCS
jgi:hypothetical protein